MEATTSTPAVLVDSPIHTSSPLLSPPHPISTSPLSQPPHIDIPSISITLSSKVDTITPNFSSSRTISSLTSPMNIPPLNTEIPLSQTEANPLVNTQQQTISPREGIAYFGEDVVVCMGKYYWSKKDKVVFKRGANRTKEGSTK